MFCQNNNDNFTGDLFFQSYDDFFGAYKYPDIILNGSFVESNLGFSMDSFGINNDLLNLPPGPLDMTKTKNFLKKKRSIQNEENKNDDNIMDNNNNNSISSNNSKINFNFEKEKDQWNENKNDNIINNNEKQIKIPSTKEDSKNKKKMSSAQIIKIKKVDINNERSLQKDNFSIILFTKINSWIIEEIILKYPNLKIYKPNYDIFTHNTNMIDIYIFLDIQYKNILCMTPEIKEELDRLLIDLKIKNKYKKKESALTEKSKEYNDVLKLLHIYGYINEKDKLDIDKVNSKIIELLINEGYKEPDDKKFYKKDKDHICTLLIKNNLKKKYDYQNKNRNNIYGHEIYEISRTLRELIILFYKSGVEFDNFCSETEKINENVKIQKNNKYSLLDNSEYNGFIKMIEEDCGLDAEQKRAIMDFTNYFKNRELSIEELKNYRDIALLEKKV